MKEQLYLRALTNVLQEAYKTGSHTKDNIIKVVFYGIKYINAYHSNNITTFEKAEDFYNLVMGISDFIRYLTPNEFMNIFSITKEYDGHKYECKDYFYTMEYLNTLKRDKSIGKQDTTTEAL